MPYSHYRKFYCLTLTMEFPILVKSHFYIEFTTGIEFLWEGLTQWWPIVKPPSGMLSPGELTHWGQDKIATISQTTFSSAFCWMKTFEFQIKFEFSNWQYINIGSDNGLMPTRQQAIIWTNGGMFYWHIYASLDFNELTNRGLNR